MKCSCKKKELNDGKGPSEAERERGGDQIFFSCIKRNISILDSVLASVKANSSRSEDTPERKIGTNGKKGKIKILYCRAGSNGLTDSHA